MSIILYIITKYKWSHECTLVFSSETTSSAYAYATALKYSTKYFWRFKAKVGGVWGAWSPAWRFYSMDPLAAPPLISPAHKEIMISPDVTFEWSPVENAALYKIQVARDSAFVNKIVKQNVVELSALFTLPTGNYYWRVKAIDTEGFKSPWSEVGKFKVVP